jgi:hypothetical protein
MDAVACDSQNGSAVAAAAPRRIGQQIDRPRSFARFPEAKSDLRVGGHGLSSGPARGIRAAGEKQKLAARAHNDVETRS